MATVYERLGSQVLPRKLDDIGLENAHQYTPNEDKTKKEKTFSQLAEEPKPTPEVEDSYRGADILLPRGDQMARGQCSQ